MSSKGLNAFCAEIGADPNEVRHILRRMKEFVEEDIDNRVIVHQLGVFKNVFQDERWFYRHPEMWNVPPRNHISLKRPPRSGTKQATFSASDTMQVRFWGMSDHPNLIDRLNIRDGVVIGHNVENEPPGWIKRPRFIRVMDNKRRIQIWSRLMIPDNGSFIVDINSSESTTFERTRNGWLISNATDGGYRHMQVHSGSWNSLIGLSNPTLRGYGSDGWEGSKARAALLKVFELVNPRAKPDNLADLPW